MSAPGLLRIFGTREEARQWLLDNDYTPRSSWLPINTTPGLWCKVTGEAVQAFASLAGGWTVQDYREPHPANFICE